MVRAPSFIGAVQFGVARSLRATLATLAVATTLMAVDGALAQSRSRPNDAYRPPENSGTTLGTLPAPEAPSSGGYNKPTSSYGDPVPNDGYRDDTYRRDDRTRGSNPERPDDRYATRPGYGDPYSVPSEENLRGDRGRPPGRGDEDHDRPNETSYTRGEISDAGGRFFGSISKGLASAIEYTYQRAGRPNGYILGEDAGGAFIGGLRYGEGRLHTKDAGTHKVFWQGPSLGYDVGGEGSKVMILIYNLREIDEIYERFGGVEGSAYLVGGVSVQFQKRGDVIMAPIRSGVGLRLGANVGYLKYTRRPTWNPF